MTEHEQPHVTEQYQITSGPLRSAISIELHTHLATRLWQGRRANPAERIYGIIGMPRFLNIINVIRMDSTIDNPYADIYMLSLEERLNAAREEMNTLINSMEIVFKQIPEMMTIENCLSVQPVRFPVFSSSPLGFIAVYLLTDFDNLMRNLMLAQHMALINRTELNDLRQRGGNIIRSLFVLAQKYQRIPVTRRDIYEGNARAKAAQELVGPVPDDILNGSRRSAYSLPLRQAESALDTQTGAATLDDVNDETDLTVSQGTEPETKDDQ